MPTLREGNAPAQQTRQNQTAFFCYYARSHLMFRQPLVKQARVYEELACLGSCGSPHAVQTPVGTLSVSGRRRRDRAIPGWLHITFNRKFERHSMLLDL
jgi:hypothetical protein